MTDDDWSEVIQYTNRHGTAGRVGGDDHVFRAKNAIEGALRHDEITFDDEVRVTIEVKKRG